MEPSLIGFYGGVLFAFVLLKTKPAFFWEHYKVRKARDLLGDALAERIGYAFLAFVTVLFTAIAHLSN